MKRFIWNLRYALELRFNCGWSWRLSWEAAKASEDSYEEGLSPRDATIEDIRD